VFGSPSNPTEESGERCVRALITMLHSYGCPGNRVQGNKTQVRERCAVALIIKSAQLWCCGDIQAKITKRKCRKSNDQTEQ